MNRSALILAIIVAFCCIVQSAFAQVELVEIRCRSGYAERFLQGASPEDEASNVQQIIVVCERNQQIRNIFIPIDPSQPAHNQPLIAGQYGTAKSELLGITLPRFLVPGNTCPLFPISAYLEHNICPVSGSDGITASIIE